METITHITQPAGDIECRVSSGPTIGMLLGVERRGRFYRVETNQGGWDKKQRVSKEQYRKEFPLNPPEEEKERWENN